MPGVQEIDYLAIGPPLLLAIAALVVLCVDLFLPGARQGMLNSVALAAVLGALVVEVTLATKVDDAVRGTFCAPVGSGAAETSCSYVADDATVVLQLVMLVAGVVVLLMARAEVRDTRLPGGEYHFLVLAALCGALSLAAGRDLLTLVVSLEVVSLPVFALVALRRYDGRASEAALKMFLVSVVSTAVMLFGISLVYGVTGTTYLDRIAVSLQGVAPDQGPVAAAGVVLVLVGFGFKISAVPFHFWAPDTYQGAPVSVAAFLSVVSKTAGFAGLIVVLTVGFGPYAYVWGPLVAVLAAVTMTVGNLVALWQRNAVRLLAWSSIAQAGFMLAPLGALAGVAGVGGGTEGSADQRALIGATVAYIAIYSVMNIGAFAVVAALSRLTPGSAGSIDAHRGLVRTHPVLAVALAFFLACLAGLPPGLAGLFAKIVVFRATVTGGYGWLAVVMAVNTVIGLAYYLAWGSRLFAAPDGARAVAGRVPLPATVAIGVAVVGAIVLSFAPQLVLGFAPAGIFAAG